MSFPIRDQVQEGYYERLALGLSFLSKAIVSPTVWLQYKKKGPILRQFLEDVLNIPLRDDMQLAFLTRLQRRDQEAWGLLLAALHPHQRTRLLPHSPWPQMRQVLVFEMRDLDGDTEFSTTVAYLTKMPGVFQMRVEPPMNYTHFLLFLP
jgi:hypothetical protein